MIGLPGKGCVSVIVTHTDIRVGFMNKHSLDESPSHLLHRVLQIAVDIYNGETGEGALSQRQYAVLMALDAESEGLSQTDLVRITGIDRSTLAELVQRMLAKNLVARERSSVDARANLVRLAEEGRKALSDMQPRVLAADEKILALLSAPKRDSFVKLLRKITTAREGELDVASGEPRKKVDKIEKKKKKPKKDKTAHKNMKKMRKLPFPPLSEGVSATDETEELVHAPVVKLKV